MPCTTDWSGLVIKRFALPIFVSLIVMLLRSPEAIAQTVISKSRIGGYAEDIAYISKGRLKNNIIIMDGYEVFSVENARSSRGPLNKLFDVKIPEIDTNPNGLTYIE